MMDAIARTGSFAAAARELGKVPSALTYNVRQLEQALDVLLFDRRSRNAQLTAAGAELLAEGRRLLEQMDAVANRVRRVATGWESELSIAVDNLMEMAVVLELSAAFFALRVESPGAAAPAAPPTRLKLRSEVLAGTWEALLNGQADLAIGLVPTGVPNGDIELAPIGPLRMRLAMSPHHPLAALPEPLEDATVAQHRIVVMADSAQRIAPHSFGIGAGQEVVTVPDLRTKVQAQVLGLGCGRLPESLVNQLEARGLLVGRATTELGRGADVMYAWRRSAAQGKALSWWLQQLESPKTREALLTHRGDWAV
jgi:DNA-binding transcriptional LysR family regulator